MAESTSEIRYLAPQTVDVKRKKYCRFKKAAACLYMQVCEKTFRMGHIVIYYFIIYYSSFACDLSRRSGQVEPVEGLLHCFDLIVIVYYVFNKFERITGHEPRNDVDYLYDQPLDSLGD